MDFDPKRVQQVLRQSWSINTARQWHVNNPAAGQCNVTALLIHSIFGGDILKTELPSGVHFYNRVNGERFDFTASQFSRPIDYEDRVSSPQETAVGATREEQIHLQKAFLTHY